MLRNRLGFAILAVCFAAAAVPRGFAASVAAAGHTRKTRVYYIAADEVEWNYAPSGRDEAMGMPFDAIERGFTESGPHQIGSVYKKAIYR